VPIEEEVGQYLKSQAAIEREKKQEAEEALKDDILAWSLGLCSDDTSMNVTFICTMHLVTKHQIVFHQNPLKRMFSASRKNSEISLLYIPHS